MNTLKFSEDYEKLPINWIGTKAVLIAVVKCDIGKVHRSLPNFIEYDTKFRGKDGNYPLNRSGLYLTLILIHIDSGIPFTTLRTATQEKEAYYNNNVGLDFKLVRVEK